MTQMVRMSTDKNKGAPATTYLARMVTPHDHTLRPRIKCGVTARRPSGCALPYYRHTAPATTHPARMVTPHLMRGLKRKGTRMPPDGCRQIAFYSTPLLREGGVPKGRGGRQTNKNTSRIGTTGFHLPPPPAGTPQKKTAAGASVSTANRRPPTLPRTPNPFPL